MKNFMQNKFIVFIALLIGSIGLFSCEEDGTQVEIKKDVAANELASLSTDVVVLTSENANTNLEAFEWTAPDFGFASGETYTLQVDVAENNFADPLNLIVTSAQTATFSVADMNRLLLNLGLYPGEATGVEFRVVTTINANVETIYSSVISATFTTYATSFPPIYMIGDALQGWNTGKAVKMRSTAPSVYETVTQFTSGNKFRFFATASWDAVQYNWSFFESGSIDSELTNGGDGDGNFIFSAASGWYKIVANTNTKTITIEETTEPKLYMIGDAVQGWDLAKAVEMTRLEDGVFQVTTSLINDKIFRFFTAPDWGAGTINYPYFDDGSVDEYFVNANDGDKNFKVAGASGEYVITVDLYALTVTIAEPSAPEVIYIIGDNNGWSLDTPVALNSIGFNKFEGTFSISNGNIFRFFLTPDWGATQWGWSYFIGGTVDANLADGGGGDSNLLFNGATGNYKITVDLKNKTIVMAVQ